MRNYAVASRYANALYEEAKAGGIVDVVAGDMQQLDSLMKQSKEFSTLVVSPALGIDEKLAVIDAIGKSGKIDRLTYGLLVVLTRKARLPLLESVIDAVRQRIMQERGEIEVNVSYAVEVDDAIRAELTAELTKLTNKKVILRESIDGSLLGGMRIFVDSKLYDLSVRGRLESLKNEFLR